MHASRLSPHFRTAKAMNPKIWLYGGGSGGETPALRPVAQSGSK